MPGHAREDLVDLLRGGGRVNVDLNVDVNRWLLRLPGRGCRSRGLFLRHRLRCASDRRSRTPGRSCLAGRASWCGRLSRLESTLAGRLIGTRRIARRQ